MFNILVSKAIDNSVILLYRLTFFSRSPVSQRGVSLKRRCALMCPAVSYRKMSQRPKQKALGGTNGDQSQNKGEEVEALRQGQILKTKVGGPVVYLTVFLSSEGVT